MLVMYQKPIGAMGNQLFQKHILVQLGIKLNSSVWHRSFDIDAEFLISKKGNLSKIYVPRNCASLSSEDFVTLNPADVIERLTRNIMSKELVVVQSGILGEAFFDYCFIDPKDIFKFANSPVSPQETYVALHFRGKDFRHWNPAAILPLEYYVLAIEYVLKKNPKLKIKIFTDEPEHETIREISKLFTTEIASSKSAIADLQLMSQADYLISSPSTFCFWAGVLGATTKIIHSSDWLKLCTNDSFWSRMLRGGNQYYRIHDII